MTTAERRSARTVLTPGSRVVDLGVPPAWMADGVCTDPSTDPDWWFADPQSPEGLKAERLCRTCPVLLTCRSYARHNEAGPEESGIWGGGDFNAEWNRCANNHWETPESRNRSGECRSCVAARKSKQRTAA